MSTDSSPQRSPVPSERLAELGIALPTVAAPVAAYVPAVQVGDMVYTSGQLPFIAGELPATGLVGVPKNTPEAPAAARPEVTAEAAYDLARTATLNALAAIDDLAGIDNIERIVKVTGFVASAPGFGGQPGVVNGASDLLGHIFGDAGTHARAAVGVAELPLGSPVEIEVMAQIRHSAK
ncbi:RidA family protein [Corynebacterium heidelbergense]|uniref:LysR family transcriptional regulator n=1 Tax=Corynebacterium heidelbergense TaxID=2055947 RepID=A0A364V9K9_9CORY|nr:RidA family protein [Corynebacterium heidelbergense]RAV33298.1 LysR family transcriptional regulator [Corynebacterium heidelbergense]WCZ37487.1 putative endoribonuclease L-PSP [Corynebacterium heidelbergense]